MARLVRLCTQCGATDDRRSWASRDEAADAGAFAVPWTCATCAWTEFELVEASDESAPDAEPELEHARAATRGGGAGGIDPTFRAPS